MNELLCDENQLSEFAADVAKTLKIGDIFLLDGELGSGKTTFTKHLVKHLGGDKSRVTSPTFNLLYLYELDAFTIWHFDLYRIKNSDELLNINLEDALTSGVTIMEWGEIARPMLPKTYKEISFEHTDQLGIRKILF